jgi:hypothetical protein
MPKTMKIPKSYRYYKLEDLNLIWNVKQKETIQMLEPIKFITPSNLLVEVLERNFRIPMNNEKAKSELIVMPILVEMCVKNQNFKPISGMTFNIEPEKGLKGTCDFLVSANPDSVELDSPVVCIFEAKNDAIEDWYGQCGAEMFASRIFNERKGNNLKIIHGAVTNGFTWQFLKLEEQTLYIDSQRYGTANLPQLLGAIQKIYDFYK